MSSSGSDSSDEDYVPSDCASQPPSEVESEGDEEDSDVHDEDVVKNGHKGKKKGKKLKKCDDPVEPPKEKQETEDNKQKSESLWSDFLKDVSQDERSKEDSVPESSKPKVEKKIVTEVYEFAGERISVSKEVDSAVPAKIRKTSPDLDKSINSYLSEENIQKPEPGPAEVDDEVTKPVPGVSRKSAVGLSEKSHAITKKNISANRSNLSSALDRLGKKNKLSTLEKSKLDWENYKSKEGIREEISAHNKGKSGYLDKQDFLEKADFKQYELEKQMRNTLRRKL